ncbi:hypothetical protein ERO13_A05G312801v2 [Gossypium hirsutum]|nr:hypothetical protein ERO13_A05G312801v2 [Gossypium hirsutum]
MRFVWFLRKYFIRVWKIFFTTSSFHFPEKMLGLTENPKLDLASSNKISTQKISVSDHIGGFQYTVDKHDSFVIDMDSFSYGGLNKGINQNPRITPNIRKILPPVDCKLSYRSDCGNAVSTVQIIEAFICFLIDLRFLYK